MATKAELLADAKELGLDVNENMSNAQLQDAIDQHLAGASNTTAPDGVTPAGDVSGQAPSKGNSSDEDEEEQETPEEKEAREAKEKEAEEAAAEQKRKDDEEQKAAEAEQKRLEEEAKAAKEGRSQGSEIASAIVEGLKANKEDKRIRIKSDKSVVSRYSIVRNKQTGEVMIRENETGLLSKVQLESLEEKEASLQTTEVEEL